MSVVLDIPELCVQPEGTVTAVIVIVIVIVHLEKSNHLIVDRNPNGYIEHIS